MTIFFVGAFNPITGSGLHSGSGAGAKVQYEIIRSISVDNPGVKSLVMQESRTWPFNHLIINEQKDGDITFLRMINIAVLKQAVFALSVFTKLLFGNPRKVYFYNTTAFMNVFMFLYGLVKKDTKKILIIQDLNIIEKVSLSNFYRVDKVVEYWAFKLTKFSFDCFVPITKELGERLEFPESRSFPFLGAVTSELEIEPLLVKSNTAVFAGALERYNGVDVLLESWSQLNTDLTLHIFGAGTLADTVSSYASKHKSIVYHGFQSPSTVKDYITSASINFCLRYSRGLKQEYFFPSKFFDVCSSPGLVVCNDFKNIPQSLREFIYFVDEDLLNLDKIVNACSELSSFHTQRVEAINNNISWSRMIKHIDEFTGEMCG